MLSRVHVSTEDHPKSDKQLGAVVLGLLCIHSSRGRLDHCPLGEALKRGGIGGNGMRNKLANISSGLKCNYNV